MSGLGEDRQVPPRARDFHADGRRLANRRGSAIEGSELSKSNCHNRADLSHPCAIYTLPSVGITICTSGPVANGCTARKAPFLSAHPASRTVPSENQHLRRPCTECR